MRTSHKLTHVLGLLAAILVLATASFAQGVAADSTVQVSDQKAGSMLVFPFYGSDGTAANDTRISITNVGPVGGNTNNTATVISNSLNVHLFWLDSSCSQADGYICFTKFQQWVLKASEWDPVTARGVLIAVAVDVMGYPISYNGLIGNAFVNCNVTQSGATERWLGNYGAEAFTSVGVAVAAPAGQAGVYYTDPAATAAGATSAVLALNNAPRNTLAAAVPAPAGYDAGANSFAAEFQSTKDSTGQTILTVGLTGTIGGALDGNTVDNNRIAAIYRADEKLYSWTGGGGGCQVLVRLTDTNPRILGGLGAQIGTGKTGTVVWVTSAGAAGNNATGNAVGLFVTPSTGNNAWVGIRGLHKRDAGTGALRMPVFMPICVI